MSDKPSNNGGKTVKGRFGAANQYGRGRPAGSRNKATLAIEKLLGNEAEAITRKCIDLALEGDTTALRLVMERVAPLRKGRPVTLKLPRIVSAKDVLVALSTVAESMSTGEITPEEAAIIAGMLETKRKAIETVELEARIAQLEQTAGEKQL